MSMESKVLQVCLVKQFHRENREQAQMDKMKYCIKKYINIFLLENCIGHI